MEAIEIKSEYSTQPFRQKPNPMVEKSIRYIMEKGGFSEDCKIADQGCGALRHLRVLVKYYNYIYMVDTELQLNRSIEIEGKKTTIKDYISDLNVPNKTFGLMSNKEFLGTNLGLDIIFNLCTFDVVLPAARKEMLEAAKKNLRKGGNFILTIPRNDSSILCRCKKENTHTDGYYFKNRGAYTFYTNFRDHNGLLNMTSEYNFELVKDMSIYRHVCLIFTSK